MAKTQTIQSRDCMLICQTYVAYPGHAAARAITTMLCAGSNACQGCGARKAGAEACKHAREHQGSEVHMNVSVCTYMYIYIYIYIYIYMHILGSEACKHAREDEESEARMHVPMSMREYSMCMYVYMYTCMYTYILCDLRICECICL